jgi:DNA repair protein RadC
LLLGRCLPHPLVEPAVAALTDRFGSLGDILAAEVSELKRTVGLGPAAVLDLKLLRELSVRLSRTAACARPVLSSWNALEAYARTALAHLPREQFRTLFLDRRNILLRDEIVADGSVDHAPVYPREVIRRALELSASALILVHNHPSGDPTPSQADIAVTRQVVDAARLFNIQVHDHLVIGREGTASFRTLGLF